MAAAVEGGLSTCQLDKDEHHALAATLEGVRGQKPTGEQVRHWVNNFTRPNAKDPTLQVLLTLQARQTAALANTAAKIDKLRARINGEDGDAADSNPAATTYAKAPPACDISSGAAAAGSIPTASSAASSRKALAGATTDGNVSTDIGSALNQRFSIIEDQISRHIELTKKQNDHVLQLLERISKRQDDLFGPSVASSDHEQDQKKGQSKKRKAEADLPAPDGTISSSE